MHVSFYVRKIPHHAEPEPGLALGDDGSGRPAPRTQKEPRSASSLSDSRSDSTFGAVSPNGSPEPLRGSVPPGAAAPPSTPTPPPSGVVEGGPAGQAAGQPSQTQLVEMGAIAAVAAVAGAACCLVIVLIGQKYSRGGPRASMPGRQQRAIIGVDGAAPITTITPHEKASRKELPSSTLARGAVDPAESQTEMASVVLEDKI